MKHIFIIKATILSGLLVIGCSRNNESAHMELSAEKEPTHATPVSAAFEIDSVPVKIGCSGKITVPPQGVVSIGNGVAANIHQITVLPGQQVKKGQVLAVLQHRNLIALQSDYLVQVEKTKVLEMDYQRKSELSASNAISDSEFQQTQAALSEARAILDGMHKELLLIGISSDLIQTNGIQMSVPVKAPVDGIVQKVNVYEGQYLAEDQPIFILIKATALHVDLSVFARDAGFIALSQRIEFSISGLQKTFTAYVELIAPMLDENNTLTIHAEINPADMAQLHPGTPVSATIFAGTRTRYLISSDAIEFDGTTAYRKGDRKTPIELGSLIDGKYEVLNRHHLN